MQSIPTLRRVLPIEDQPELVEAMAKYVDRNRATVCKVCGLQVMGHGPESAWLGYERHDYEATPASQRQIDYAAAKSSRAYRSSGYMQPPRKLWGRHVQHKRGESYA